MRKSAVIVVQRKLSERSRLIFVLLLMEELSTES